MLHTWRSISLMNYSLTDNIVPVEIKVSTFFLVSKNCQVEAKDKYISTKILKKIFF